MVKVLSFRSVLELMHKSRSEGLKASSTPYEQEIYPGHCSRKRFHGPGVTSFLKTYFEMTKDDKKQ